MTYQQGYPQQPPWHGGGRRTNPATAIIAAIVGLGIAGMLSYLNIDLLRRLQDTTELPGELTTMIILRFAVAAIALLGAILVFARQLAGAFLLIAAAVLAIVVIVIEPTIFEFAAATMIGSLPEVTSTSATGAYFEAMFEFGNEQAVLRALSLFAAPVLLLLSVLPPTLNYLKGSSPGQVPQYW